MAEQAPSSRWRAWLEKQAQPQGYGSYLARPWGYFSGIYQIDETTKRRWIAFRMAYFWLTVAVIVPSVWVISEADRWTLRVFMPGMLAFAALMLVGYGGLFLIFRHAPRVAPEHWQGPAVVDRWGRYPLSTWRRSMVGSGAFTLLFIGWAIFSDAPGSLRQSLPPILVFAALFLVALFSYRRARQRPAEPGISWPKGVTRSPRHRTWLAILIAPSGTALLLAVGGWLGQMMIADGSQHGPHGRSWLLWLVAISYALSYTAGIPVYLLARRRGWLSWEAHLGGGFLIGGVAVLLLGVLGLMLPSATSPHLSAAALLGGAIVIGIFMQPVGLLFWLIARPDRPA